MPILAFGIPLTLLLTMIR